MAHAAVETARLRRRRCAHGPLRCGIGRTEERRRSACRPRPRGAAARCRRRPRARAPRRAPADSASVVGGASVRRAARTLDDRARQRLLAGPPGHDHGSPWPRADASATAPKRSGGHRLFGQPAPGLMHRVRRRTGRGRCASLGDGGWRCASRRLDRGRSGDAERAQQREVLLDHVAVGARIDRSRCRRHAALRLAQRVAREADHPPRAREPRQHRRLDQPLEVERRRRSALTQARMALIARMPPAEAGAAQPPAEASPHVRPHVGAPADRTGRARRDAAIDQPVDLRRPGIAARAPAPPAARARCRRARPAGRSALFTSAAIRLQQQIARRVILRIADDRDAAAVAERRSRARARCRRCSRCPCSARRLQALEQRRRPCRRRRSRRSRRRAAPPPARRDRLLVQDRTAVALQPPHRRVAVDRHDQPIGLARPPPADSARGRRAADRSRRWRTRSCGRGALGPRRTRRRHRA